MNDFDGLLQRLRNHPLLSPRYCDNCGHQHAPSDLTLAEHTGEGNIIFQLSCPSCGLMQIMRITPGGPMAIQRYEVNNTDVSGEELQRFAGKPSIATEETLDVYEDMQSVESLDQFLKLTVS